MQDTGQVGDYRRRDRLGRLEPRNPLADGVLLGQALPSPKPKVREWSHGMGFLELWDQVVPETHLLVATDRLGRSQRILLCPCGSETILLPASPTACSGVLWQADDELDPTGCTRFFLAAMGVVRVHRFTPQRWPDDTSSTLND